MCDRCDMPDLTDVPACIHAAAGEVLCESCLAAWEDDPVGYRELGDHPAGLERWRKMEAQILADVAEFGPCYPPEDSDVPF